MTENYPGQAAAAEKKVGTEIAHLYTCPACGADHENLTFVRVAYGTGHRWAARCLRFGDEVFVTSIHTEDGLI